MAKKQHKDQLRADSKASPQATRRAGGKRDPKGRTGQYTTAGNPPITKK